MKRALTSITTRLAVKFLTKVPSSMARARQYLEPIIQHRLKMQSQYGKDYPGKPVCILTDSSLSPHRDLAFLERLP